MNRDIKFRAWDNDRMLSPEDISTAPKYRSWLGKFDVPVLMQYTGIKDRNGVEIYEGDLLVNADKSGRLKDETVTVVYECTDVAGFFEATSATVGTPVAKFLLASPTWSWQPLIIGNIYENPELLKEVV